MGGITIGGTSSSPSPPIPEPGGVTGGITGGVVALVVSLQSHLSLKVLSEFSLI